MDWEFCCVRNTEDEDAHKKQRNEMDLDQVPSLLRIHKNEQWLDRPFTRLLLDALCIKKGIYLQVRGIDL